MAQQLMASLPENLGLILSIHKNFTKENKSEKKNSQM